MSKTKSKILLSILLILVLVSSYCFATDATQTSVEDTATITETSEENHDHEDEETPSWTNSDLYLCEDKVTVSNVVDGNAFIIGKDVTISGEIGGDLFVMADKLTINGGYIYSSIFACANEININGVIYDVYAICNSFNLQEDGFIYRDMKVTANSVNMAGKVRRNADISAANISFSEEAGTIIYGNLNYSSSSEINVPENAVSGEVKYTPEEQKMVSENIGSTILSYVLDLLKTLLYTFVVTLILLWLTPKFIERVSNMSIKKSFASLGIGFAAFIAFFVFIIIGIFLLISAVGTPILVSGIFASILVGYLGNSVASIFFGKLLAKKFKMEDNIKFVLFTLASSLIIWVISQIPFIGGLFGFLVWLFGIGTLLVNMVIRNEKIIEKTEVKE